MSQLYDNYSLMNFFFRNQAENTLLDLIQESVETAEIVLDTIEDYANVNFLSVDDIEEMFYNDSVQEIAESIGIGLKSENND